MHKTISNFGFSLGSLFSGIEGFGLGFQNAGFQIKWQVERDAFCRRVLRNHWPAVHRFADVRKCGSGLYLQPSGERQRNLKSVDCITAGVPCQDVSIAGRRAGLAGKRTGLFYEFARILRELRPRWFVMENVPGLLSSNGGRDFAEVLRVLMVECGYGVSWRVLDSRYFGVAQRRRRVFVVGYLGKPCPAQILFDAASGERDFKARRKARASVAAPLTHGSAVAGNAPGRRREDDENIVASCIQHRIGKGGFTDPVNDNIVTVAATIDSRHTPNGHGDAGARIEDIPNLVAGPLNVRNGHSINAEDAAGHHVVPAIAYALRRDPGEIGQGHNTNFICNALSPVRGGADDNDAQGNHIIAATLRGGGDTAASHGNQSGSDRATFAICAPPDADRMRNLAGISERLDDSPDETEWTLLPKGQDSARYRGIGNAVTVQVSEWIARKIVAYETSLQISSENLF